MPRQVEPVCANNLWIVNLHRNGWLVGKKFPFWRLRLKSLPDTRTVITVRHTHFEAKIQAAISNATPAPVSLA